MSNWREKTRSKNWRTTHPISSRVIISQDNRQAPSRFTQAWRERASLRGGHPSVKTRGLGDTSSIRERQYREGGGL